MVIYSTIGVCVDATTAVVAVCREQCQGGVTVHALSSIRIALITTSNNKYWYL